MNCSLVYRNKVTRRWTGNKPHCLEIFSERNAIFCFVCVCDHGIAILVGTLFFHYLGHCLCGDIYGCLLSKRVNWGPDLDFRNSHLNKGQISVTVNIRTRHIVVIVEVKVLGFGTQLSIWSSHKALKLVCGRVRVWVSVYRLDNFHVWLNMNYMCTVHGLYQNMY